MSAIDVRNQIVAERAAIDESALSDEERTRLHAKWRNWMIAAAFGAPPPVVGAKLTGSAVFVEINGERIFEDRKGDEITVEIPE